MNPSTAQAWTIVDELVRCGVTDAVLAPGSRSAPLALALAEAETRGDLTLHVRLDERAAGYLAVGLAKVSGIPAAVVTTSGTAAVNLHPAVVEADQSAVPVLLLTADRPPSLRGIGANQTVRQPGMFGSSVRYAADLATADTATGQQRYWRSSIARAVAAATDATHPGPVHVNVSFADPLVPDGDDTWIELLSGRSDGRPWTADGRLVGGISTPLDDALDGLVGEGGVPTRGLVVVGDLSSFGDVTDQIEVASMADDLADALGWPLIAEPSGNSSASQTALSHGPLLAAVESFVQDHTPDLVVCVGRIGLDRAVLRLIAGAGLQVSVDPHPEWSDPTRSADLVVASVPLPPETADVDDSWLPAWQGADVVAAAAVETALSTHGATLTGIQVARAAVGRVPVGGLLFVGPSWPVRHIGAFAAAGVRDGVVLGNRGTSGIDGCVSSAWGAAVAMQRAGGAGAVALMGDQTFVYGIAGLLAPAQEERPDLVYIVVDNDGGGIFSSLEQGAQGSTETFERVFGVPLGLDVAAVARAHGIPAVVVDTAASLVEAVDAAAGTGGVHVVVARTCEREREADLLRRVGVAVDQAVGTR